MVHRTKLKRFDFTCPCCNEIIFSSAHFFTKGPFSIVGQKITRDNKTVLMPPTLSYVFTILLSAYPYDVETENLTTLIGAYSAAKPSVRLDPEFVDHGNLAVYLTRLKAFYRDLNFSVKRTGYKRQGLIIHDSPAT